MGKDRLSCWCELAKSGGFGEVLGVFSGSGGFDQAFRRYLNWFLLILRALILWSRVDGGIPSLAAAPDGPQTRPLVSTSAASIISRSPRGATPLSDCTDASILNEIGRASCRERV